MRRSFSIIGLLLLCGQTCLLAQGEVNAPFVMAYRDYKDYFYAFNNGTAQQLESQPVKSFISMGSIIGYINNANNLIAWYNGEKTELGDATNTVFDVTNDLLIYKRDLALSVFENGKTTDLTYFIRDYKTSDHLIAFRESTTNILKVYYESTVQDLEYTLVGSLGTYKVGKNTVAYLNSSGYFKIFDKGDLFEIDNIAPLQFEPGKNIVGYVDGIKETLNVFYNHKVLTLEQIKPLSFQVGDDLIAYVTDEGSFKIFLDGKLLKIESYAPDFYKVADDAVVFFADNKLQLMKYGIRYELDQGLPLSYQLSRGAVAWQDQAHRLHVFINGKVQSVTSENFISYELNGDVVRYQLEDGISRIYYNGKLTINNMTTSFFKLFRIYIYVIFFICSSNVLFAQSAFLPLSNEMEQRYEPSLYHVGTSFHTSIKPYLIKDIQEITPYDSLNTLPVKANYFTRSLVGRKLFSEHLLKTEKEDYKIYLDPLFEFTGGRDQKYSRKIIYNTRGIWLNGSIGKRFSFNATFYENQSNFAYYLDSSVNRRHVVPGQGRVKKTGLNYDYSFATGTITYVLDKHFTFQFGHDKTFIGDGYRSLLLSDNAFEYPFLKIITTVGKFRYMNMFTVMQDLEKDDPNDDFPFRKKYGSFHYLDLNIGNRLTVGLFEAIIWHSDTVGARGFDINYMNPFIFLRPVEFSIGSPDNALLGFNTKLELNSKNVLYGQILLDEFVLKQVTSGKGWWANKQSLQGGWKSFDVFGIKNLKLQGEINYVRPYTYSHRDPLGNYGQYREALAHPLGANFVEGIGFVKYTYKHFDLSARLSYAIVGYDTAGLNLGQNIYLSYDTHVTEYNNRVGQGQKHNITWVDLNLNYLLNPISCMSVFADVAVRKDSFHGRTNNELIFTAGIRTRLFNRYYDF